ncbi:protein prenyltransferase alpha subunit repeat-containing protein 1 [Nematostella vectensis]|uniref:protein prenyltransferase alpha subunit repeat-containing protein 1 n=1 Tax=Nematostella vectensis TaxID=45351 RepID=UPI002076E6C0|nr:protein prenyltransferase alpha subunit repeat-containing protein 1 [Nematostella vectensis]
MADDESMNGEMYFNILNTAFIQDPAIDEVDFIFCPKCKEEQSKDAMVVIGHKLGIRSWCIRPMYMYAYHRLLRKHRHCRVKNQSTENLTATELDQLSRAVVLLSAECYSAWNIRKELVSSGLLSVDCDLHISTLVLTKHPRSAEAFAHRKWLINYFTKQKGKSTFCQEWLREEIIVSQQAAERYPDNYVAWSHRGWVADRFIDSKKKLLCELQGMEQWVQMHISDHCGFHYRQALITKLKQLVSVCELAFLFLAELELVNSLLESLPGHESVWYHRRFLFQHWRLWFSTMPTDQLQHLALSLYENGKVEPLPANLMSCWVPCVKSLRIMCRSAMLKKRIESVLLRDVAISDWLPSLTTERAYCEKILRGKPGRQDETQQRLAVNYLKWLETLSAQSSTFGNEPAIMSTT